MPGAVLRPHMLSDADGHYRESRVFPGTPRRIEAVVVGLRRRRIDETGGVEVVLGENERERTRSSSS